MAPEPVHAFPRSFIPTLSQTKTKTKRSFVVFSKKREENALQYKKLGDSDLFISEITLGTVSYINIYFCFPVWVLILVIKGLSTKWCACALICR